jgi:nuclear GTP-binding protein
VIGQKQLDQFREEMSTKVNDAYTVLLREKKLPLQLLEDPDKKLGGKQVGLLDIACFSSSCTAYSGVLT